MEIKEKLSKMSGVSKRLFMALSGLAGNPPQLEDALFQMASVIDSTSKGHFPSENSSKKRFSDYLETVMTDLYRIATFGEATLINCTFQTNGNNSQIFRVQV